ncbi:hypothetical protein GXW82_11310 [Streptacidiphilus sp. 4-A2]|nr:hypothetical protein [Streptacidiphilus sp. 4-A2]
MRLRIEVREGDWAAFDGPYGGRIAGRVDEWVGEPDADPVQRWRDLDARIIGSTFEMPVLESMTFGELELALMRRMGLDPQADPAKLKVWLESPLADGRPGGSCGWRTPG